MAPVRQPFQGVWNILRFNWHFYAAATGLALVGGLLRTLFPPLAQPYFSVLLGLFLLPILVSLAVSAYVYDFSDLYRFTWLPAAQAPPPNATLLNINAGFDETSQLVQHRFQPATLVVVDFYDPARHTEVSIKRARQAYPPFPGTYPVSTQALPLPDNTVDEAFAFLAAHEIRDAAERAAFFREIGRVLKPTGRLVVTEHLRDPANFLAYTIGFLHFHARAAWQRTFADADLLLEQEVKITPFITGFILRKRGTSA